MTAGTTWKDKFGNPFVAEMTTPITAPGSSALKDALARRFLENGLDFMSVTVAEDADTATALRQIGEIRRFFLSQSKTCVLIDTVDDALAAKAVGKLAVSLHFQGTMPVGRDLNLVEVFYKLGIRHMLMAYNNKNLVADGCHEPGGTGLSNFGRKLVDEMNRVGMFVDVSHTSHAAAMDVLEYSNRPVIASHTNVAAIQPHARNINNEQIRAIAGSGGVIGLTGLCIFTGDDEASADGYVRHIDHIAQLVGPAHVGLGFDYVYDLPALVAFAQTMAGIWPADGGYTRTDMKQVEPEAIGAIAEGLSARGYSDDDVRNVLGGNWLRMMREIWR
ncbi:dipeptidase [Novosphingobium sp. AP12]|uniref:dipeptidase n=1 Tax=Novosphingobium sp. AP12 TaxID=1144305 RepID=UPI000272000C|nr:membrane dipeptidase [Novosphingobium sp. AP12]EJL30844.1 Zn-dependent dipeptidase, microsomal dipeptidase [Novosphingobium sp. AP12]